MITKIIRKPSQNRSYNKNYTSALWKRLYLPIYKKATKNKTQIRNGNEVTIDEETTLKKGITNSSITIFEVIQSDKDLIPLGMKFTEK